jgi:GNAT superfamily N-acetyltransferase
VPDTSAEAKKGRGVLYREMAAGEEQLVLDLAMRVFDQAVRPDFSAQGAAEFAASARRFLIDDSAGHVVFVAESDGELVGMIDVRDHSHVCLFFVEAGHRGTGVGSALLAEAVSRVLAGDPVGELLTVNSAPGAVGAYGRFGFEATAPEREHNGIRYVSMSKLLPRG